MLWFAYVLLFLYGLAHTPLLVDVLRQLFPQWNIKRLTSSVSSLILILLISFSFLLGLGMQLFVFIPHMPQVTLRPVKLVLHSLFAYWVWINAVVNYMYTLFSRPGIFRPSVKKSSIASDITPSTQPVAALGGGATVKEESSGVKKVLPATSGQENTRKSSCKICEETIPYRDHHCPFTGNCIGLNNFSHFYLTLFYSMLGLGYAVFVSFSYFGDCIFLAWRTVQKEEICTSFELYADMVLPTIGALVTVTIMFLFYTFLLLVDISTYDLLTHWRTIKFDFGKFKGENSRLRVLLLNQRTHPLWFLFPVKNRPFC